MYHSGVSRALFAQRCVAVFFLIAAIPLGYLLPEWFGWENGPIELTQDVVLFLGLFLAVSWYVSGQDLLDNWVWLAIAPLWVLCIGRELSWGAVLRAPLDMTDIGPWYSSSVLWYKPYVYPFLALVITLSAGIFLLNKGWRSIFDMMKERAMPWAELVLMAGCLIMLTAAERHYGLFGSWTSGAAQVSEELAELGVYLCLLGGQSRIRLFQIDKSVIGAKVSIWPAKSS
ncbi:hypothetical protein IFT84_05465 [Rhizobium sp. CFBP 8762]|uniref:hypothetical protein n=1 Tax=Rhizobium sp. CFBP 8762 TaxID=2775279 RepID=UPI001782A076|nr:hypothetical protein [Rhizobium sp. CFBP 8762]MBD8553967.1 hypothetical protein [Rhizobium sp. CFBP 8762]